MEKNYLFNSKETIFFSSFILSRNISVNDTPFPDPSEQIVEWGLSWYNEHLQGNVERKVLEQELFKSLPEKSQTNGYMTKEDVRKILEWTTPIDPGYIKKNSNNRIVTATKYAFEMEDEQLKIHTLRFIHGIGLPTASRILMLYDPNRYTVLNDATYYTMMKWNYIKENDLKLNLDTWEIFTNEFRELMRKLKINGITFFKLSSSLYSHYFLKEDYLPHLKLDNFF